MMTPPHDSSPLLIAVAPNGAYKTRHDHHQLPLTATQLADTAEAVVRAGATMLHLHVRDANGKHTLNADAYETAMQAIRARVGNKLFIQITSEAAGIYTATQQWQAIYALSRDATVSNRSDAHAMCDGISIALRELIRAPADLPPAKQLFHHLSRQNVLAQYILYGSRDIDQYHSLQKRKIIPSDNHSILLVVGATGAQNSTPQVLHDMLKELHAPTSKKVNWMVCAFGEHEFACLSEAAKLGGHVRVGFENSLCLKDGAIAADNAQLVTQFLAHGNPRHRPLADIPQARNILCGMS